MIYNNDFFEIIKQRRKNIKILESTIIILKIKIWLPGKGGIFNNLYKTRR